MLSPCTLPPGIAVPYPPGGISIGTFYFKVASPLTGTAGFGTLPGRTLENHGNGLYSLNPRAIPSNASFFSAARAAIRITLGI